MEEKKYASIESLRAFKTNIDNKFTTKEYVESVSSEVATKSTITLKTWTIDDMGGA